MKYNRYLESIVRNPGFVKDIPFDYGKVLTDIDKIRSGKKSLTEHLFYFPHAQIPAVTSKDIQLHSAHDVQKHMIAIGQIGYEPLGDKLLEKIIKDLTKTFDEVNVQFCLVTVPLQVNVKHDDHFAELEVPLHAEYLYAHIQKVLPIDSLVFALNTQKFVGVAGKFPLFSAKNETYYTSVHEIGHLLGLDDGYEQYYEPEEMPGTELFTDMRTLPKRIKRAYKATRPDIYRTGNVYKGKAIYRFDADSIMTDMHNVKEILDAKFPIFTEMQVYLMNEFCKKAKK